MTNSTNIQLRGNCQVCGREHAVVNGTMSKHGYTVDNGWFNGVCSGHQFAPMQQQREVTDRIIDQIRQDVEQLLAQAAQYDAGTIHPMECNVSRNHRIVKMVAWDDAPEWAQQETMSKAEYACRSRARSGALYAVDLEALLNAVHGKDLKQVDRDAKPVEIRIGERRDSKRGPLTVVNVMGVRVYWKDERGFGSWTSTTAWRKQTLLA